MGPAATDQGDGVGYVCGLVQWQSLCIYLNGWDFLFPIPLPYPNVNIKQIYTD